MKGFWRLAASKLLYFILNKANYFNNEWSIVLPWLFTLFQLLSLASLSLFFQRISRPLAPRKAAKFLSNASFITLGMTQGMAAELCPGLPARSLPSHTSQSFRVHHSLKLIRHHNQIQLLFTSHSHFDAKILAGISAARTKEEMRRSRKKSWGTLEIWDHYD